MAGPVDRGDRGPRAELRAPRRAFLSGLLGAFGLGLAAGASVRAARAAQDGAQLSGSRRAAGPSAGALGTAARRWDAIVVGAGFAGAAAARELGQAGARVLLLEARRRVGGRTFTARVGGELFELGGMWVHSTQPHVFAEVRRYGFTLVEEPEGVPERILWWNGERVREAGWREFPPLLRAALCAPPGGLPVEAPRAVLEAYVAMERVMAAYHEPAARAFPRPFEPFYSDAWRAFDAFSVRERIEALDPSRDERALLEGLLGAAVCGPFDEAGYVEMLRWWILSGGTLQGYGDSLARYRIAEGTRALLEAMLADARAEVRLGTPVRAVRHGRDGVEVETAEGQRFAAAAAILALPLNVLGRVAIDPPLDPRKRRAAAEGHAGRGRKAYVRVRGPMPKALLLAPETEPFSTVMTGRRIGEDTVLIAFGTDPERIDVRDRDAVETFVRRFLPEVRVVEVLSHDWHADPYANGTWCIFRRGQMSRDLAALREPEGRLHLAGSDYALGWRGFIDGAIEHGIEVGRRVLAELGARPRAALGAAAAGVPAATAAAAAAPREPAFAACAPCHPAERGAPHGIGPNLWGVVGRRAGTAPGYAYSPAMRARGVPWTEEALDAFLANPQAAVPGTTMPFAGIRDPEERAALVRFLATLR